MGFRRHFLASSKGLLDPPLANLMIFRVSEDDTRPDSPAVANRVFPTPAPETRSAAPVSETRLCPRPPTFYYRSCAAIPLRRAAVLPVPADNPEWKRRPGCNEPLPLT